MKKIRTLVVDDEPLARTRIVKLLEGFDYISLIGECKNGKEALQLIESYKPDLVFLDIQMPDLNGFELLSSLESDPMPFIIFVTAYDHYALKAFGVHAVDYLLKPYDDERFSNAIEHAKNQIRLKQNSFLHHKMVKLLEDFQHQQEDHPDIIEIRDKGKICYLNQFDIYYVKSQGNYVQLYLQRGSHLLRQTLHSLEFQLAKNAFLRIHRSVIVNTNYIENIRYRENNQYLFHLKNGKQILSSRSYKKNILQYLDDEQLKKSIEL